MIKIIDQGIPRLNTVFLTGYLGQDPKPKYFDSGKVVLNLSLAVKREYHPIEVRCGVLTLQQLLATYASCVGQGERSSHVPYVSDT